MKTNAVAGSSDGALQDYPVRFIVHSGYGIDNGPNVYLNGHSQSWPDDIRFTDDKDALLSYWVESRNTERAVIWVKIDDIPASPNTSEVRLYYGKVNDTSVSSGKATFLLYDSFDDAFDSTLWTKILGPGAMVTPHNGELDFLGGGQDPDRPLVKSKDKFGRGIMITADVKAYSSDSIAGVVLDWDGDIGGRWNSPYSAYALEYCLPGAGEEFRIIKYENGMYPAPLSNVSATGDLNWHRISFGIDRNGKIHGWFDDELEISVADTTYTNGSVGLYGREQPYNVREGFKNVYVRNWTSQEPSPGTWGAEKAVQQPISDGLTPLVLLALLVAILIIIVLIIAVFIMAGYIFTRK